MLEAIWFLPFGCSRAQLLSVAGSDYLKVSVQLLPDACRLLNSWTVR